MPKVIPTNGAPEIRSRKKNPLPPPSNVIAKPGNGRNFTTWDPVPEALYYNIYFLTTKGVQIKFSELTRPIAGPDDLIPSRVSRRRKETLSKAQPPFIHEDLANGTCYHYVVTVVTGRGKAQNRPKSLRFRHRIS